MQELFESRALAEQEDFDDLGGSDEDEGDMAVLCSGSMVRALRLAISSFC